MKKLLPLFLLCLASTAFGQAAWFSAVLNNANSSAAGGGGGSYLYQQDFESGTAPANWTSSGTVAWNYATAPAPLLGSFSLETEAGGYATYDYGSDLTEVYFFIEFSEHTASDGILTITDTATTTMTYIALVGGSGNRPQLDGNASGATTAAGITFDTKIYLWGHAKQGTGANEVLEIWWSTTSTKPADGDPNYYAITTTGSRTGAARFWKWGSGTGPTIIDHFIISSTPIGSNP